MNFEHYVAVKLKEGAKKSLLESSSDRYFVGAINRYGDEVQKKFTDLEDAIAYAKKCEDHGCGGIYIRDLEAQEFIDFNKH